ncbi:MAG: alpha-glucosidase [Candidatus Izemoplasmatales bacterium]
MKKTWFREGFVYQIYPRSFQDSNGDGIGDLQGIISRIPYLVSLGVSMVWLSPVYLSPNDDNGYDISDYYDIQPDFGTLDDMKELISKFHANGIKLIMDLVVNHTSDEHPWFIQSKKNIPPFNDYYHWSPKKKNWTSFFGGEAWTKDETRNEYYLHLFSKKQPDLNWDHPGVREGVKDIMRFWLNLGVDGFRCDVINLIAKEDGLPNGKPGIILVGKEHYMNHPKIHPYLQELRDDVLSKYDCFTVGETAFVSPETALKYIDEDIRELDMVFQFDHMAADIHYVKWFMKKFKPINLKKPLSKWQRGLYPNGWNSLYLENHDQPRSVSRFGSVEYHYESATMLATMLYFQQGTPYIYQGQELGMTNIEFDDLDDYKDIESHNIYHFGRKLMMSHGRMMHKLKKMSRDNARTPMQWSHEENAGFTTNQPWIKINRNYEKINVTDEETDPKSILNYYKQIVALRKMYPVIVYGKYEDIQFHHKTLYAYSRTLEKEKLIVVCNLSDRDLKLKSSINLSEYQCVLHNYDEVSNETLLKPYEARVYYRKSE